MLHFEVCFWLLSVMWYCVACDRTDSGGLVEQENNQFKRRAQTGLQVQNMDYFV